MNNILINRLNTVVSMILTWVKGVTADDLSQSLRVKLTVLCCVVDQELLESYEAEGHGRPRLLLSAAVTADTDAIDLGYEIPEISK